MVDMVVELAENIRTSVEKMDSQGEEIKEQKSLLEKVKKTVKSNIEEQASSMAELMEVSMLLEAKVLGYRGSHEAIVLCRNLDDVRFAIANGFILALPQHFTVKLVNRYNPTGSSVVWWKFTDAVMKAWWAFHDYKQLDEDKEHYFCIQYESVFSNLPWKGNEPHAAVVNEVTRNISPNELFCNERGRLLPTDVTQKEEPGNDALL
ncbi:hypothetical protein ACEPAI_1650 [Sanghuangporus weigelae]